MEKFGNFCLFPIIFPAWLGSLTGLFLQQWSYVPAVNRNFWRSFSFNWWKTNPSTLLLALYNSSQPTGISCWLLCGSFCSLSYIFLVGLEKPKFLCKNPSNLSWFIQRTTSSLFALGDRTAFTSLFSQTSSTVVYPLHSLPSPFRCLHKQGALRSQEGVL